MVLKCEKQHRKIVGKLAEKLQISDEWNGYPEIFSLSRPLEIF